MICISLASIIAILSLVSSPVRVQKPIKVGGLQEIIVSVDGTLSEKEVSSSKYTGITRRDAFLLALTGMSSAFSLIGQPRSSWSVDIGTNKVVRLTSPQQRLGIELTETRIGNPPRTVTVVSRVDPRGQAAKQNIEPGLVLDLPPKILFERMKNGPYPIDLNFINLAAGGDAFGDLGKPLVTPKDALDLARESSDNVANQSTARGSGYEITVLQKPNSADTIKSRRGDVLEIQYTAAYYLDNKEKIVYDTSAQRGTGLPYQFVLGSGDMIPGVDQGLYDMCPGEVRILDIPKQLGFGDRGNKLFRIPGGARLHWTVELISVNTVRVGDGRAREDMDY